MTFSSEALLMLWTGWTEQETVSYLILTLAAVVFGGLLLEGILRKLGNLILEYAERRKKGDGV